MAHEGRKGSRRMPGEGTEGLDRRRGVFMISVAAELAEMHPQTLRMYETRGLITPKRSPKNTRLYSYEDVERLRRIQQMTGEDGLNLAGVETVLGLERELERARAEMTRMRRRAAELEREMNAELERVRSSRTARTRGRSPIGDPARRGRRSARIRSRSRSSALRAAAGTAEEPLGDTTHRLDRVLVGRLIIREHGHRQLPRSVALPKLGRLMGEGVIG